MARGHQKLQSQAKTQEKTAKIKKQQGHSATEQKKAAQKALVHACAICKVISVEHLNFNRLIEARIFINSLRCLIRKRISNISKTNILKMTYLLN